jgi:hypothetical protein
VSQWPANKGVHLFPERTHSGHNSDILMPPAQIEKLFTNDQWIELASNFESAAGL